jgi:hypothetical protein
MKQRDQWNSNCYFKLLRFKFNNKKKKKKKRGPSFYIIKYFVTRVPPFNILIFHPINLIKKHAKVSYIYTKT